MLDASLPVTQPTVPTPSAAVAAKAPGMREYAAVSVFLALYGFGLELATRAHEAVAREALIAPMGGMAAVTFAVWLVMLFFRNGAIIYGKSTGAHYIDYRSDPPPDWIERPARAFNNLMQVPTLFYVVCLALMITERVDHAAVLLGWMFVATRAVHAVVYMAWNYLPCRFATWVASTLALIVMWWRFVLS
jgi:hypothetical protein